MSHLRIVPRIAADSYGSTGVSQSQADSTYDVRRCDAIGSNCSAALRIETAKCGDVVAVFDGAGQPNFADIAAVVDKFKSLSMAPDTPRTDLVGPGPGGVPNTPEQSTDFRDISADVDAFKSILYLYTVSTGP